MLKLIFLQFARVGAKGGRPAVFCRFSGCNLWTGMEMDRDTAICQFCDTEFVGTDGTDGGKFSNARGLATAVDGHWPEHTKGKKFVVCTGGEPLLQLDSMLVVALHEAGFEIAIETMGLCPLLKESTGFASVRKQDRNWYFSRDQNSNSSIRKREQRRSNTIT